MNIACIAADLFPKRLGGAEVHAVEAIRRLAKNHQVTIFVGPDDGIKDILPNNVTIVPISYPHIPNLYGICYILWGYGQIKQYLARHPVDVLWAKQCFPQAIVAAMLKRTLHKPLYITAQNPNLMTEELVIKGSLLQPFQSIFANLINQGISWSFQQADCVAAVSEYSKKAAIQFGAKDVITIPNGYDAKVMKPVSKKKHSEFTIITTSSLIPRNGIDTLIKAVSLLPNSIPWKLIIAGDGPEKEKLEKLNYTLNPNSSRISFLGRASNDKIPSLLQQADLFVRPSRWEGFGVSFIEAMACGIPVIGTPVGGIPDFLFPDKTGISVPVDNVTALTHAISKLERDDVLREKLVKNAQTLVEARYKWDTIAKKVESTMSSLLTYPLHPKPSVLIVTPIFPPEIGGPSTYVPEIAKRLNASVITFSDYLVSHPKGAPSGYPVTSISLQGNSFTRQFRLLRAVYHQLSQIDTLYIQGTIVVGLSAYLGRLMGKRIVIKFVGDEVWESYRQHSRSGVAPAAHSGSECLSLEEFYSSNPKSLLLSLHRMILKSAHQVVVPSQYLKDFLVKYHRINPDHISIIPNATEILSPKPYRLSTQKSAYQLIFVGRLVPWKHVDEIIKAVEIARKTHPWELDIVGDGPEITKLKNLCYTLNPNPSYISFLGQLSKQKTLQMIASSRALILYSSYEGHPHTVLEAHALGVPTIVSNIPPHRDLGSFAIVEPHNPTALAKAINSLKTIKKITPPLPPTWSDHLAKLVDVLKN